MDFQAPNLSVIEDQDSTQRHECADSEVSGSRPHPGPENLDDTEQDINVDQFPLSEENETLGDYTMRRLAELTSTVTPRVTLNSSFHCDHRTVINDLDELFEYYDSQLSLAIEKADGMTDQIEETTESTLTEYIAFGALGLSLSNFIILCVTCRYTFRTAGHYNKDHQLGHTPTPARQMCKHCKKPVKKRTTAITENTIKEL
ncbi:hypothetical protein OS493_035006 [Desmophyllum pertusum]|uniref:Uncharacterized protein n=1 Tax=Desmophyllum pertusum TaxID=174260 RepID=A0A9W9Y7P8_9CNID|nr:hypothetical protein OS493_035006 [Desmophyllum pertusum]